jgi:hypothetical protein
MAIGHEEMMYMKSSIIVLDGYSSLHHWGREKIIHNKRSIIVRSSNHSIGTCRMRLFLAVLRSFFHSLSFHSSPPTSLPSSLTLSCHLFLGPPLSLVFSFFFYNTFLGTLFSSTLCTCQNQRNLFNLTVSVIVGFLTIIIVYDGYNSIHHAIIFNIWPLSVLLITPWIS